MSTDYLSQADTEAYRDLEIPLVSQSTANKFNKKWKQGYLSVLQHSQDCTETPRRV